MNKFEALYSNLKELMESNIGSNALLELKEKINYDNNKFYNVSQLRSYIKNNSDSNDDKALFCISTLFDIQLLIEKYEEEGQLPTRDIDNSPLTFNQLVEKDNTERRSRRPNQIKYTTHMLDKPLKWGKLSLSDYYKLDLDNLKITHEVVKE